MPEFYSLMFWYDLRGRSLFQAEVGLSLLLVFFYLAFHVCN